VTAAQNLWHCLATRPLYNRPRETGVACTTLIIIESKRLNIANSLKAQKTLLPNKNFWNWQLLVKKRPIRWMIVERVGNWQTSANCSIQANARQYRAGFLVRETRSGYDGATRRHELRLM
jgi:hypothetical protein